MCCWALAGVCVQAGTCGCQSICPVWHALRACGFGERTGQTPLLWMGHRRTLHDVQLAGLLPRPFWSHPTRSTGPQASFDRSSVKVLTCLPAHKGSVLNQGFLRKVHGRRTVLSSSQPGWEAGWCCNSSTRHGLASTLFAASKLSQEIVQMGGSCLLKRLACILLAPQ